MMSGEKTELPLWLKWARELQATAQNGLTYTENPFDVERFERIREIAVEMLSYQTGADIETVREIIQAQAGYITPKIDVRGAVFRDDRILLVREIRDGGRWTLPGGWADVDESPSFSVEKEVREESGYHVKAVKLAMLQDRNCHNHPPSLFSIYKLFFLCNLIGGNAADSIETEGAAFFPEDDLPELSVSRTTPGQVSRLFYHYRNPDAPTDFD